MKKIMIIILAGLLSSCSANYHLTKALNKDPTIIDTKADTMIIVNETIIDTTLIVELDTNIYYASDTGKADTVFKYNVIPVVNPELYAFSQDSTARAYAYIKGDRLYLETWAICDTTFVYRDTAFISFSVLDSLITVTKQNKAKIKKKTKLQNFLILTIILIVVLTAAYIIFRRV